MKAAPETPSHSKHGEIPAAAVTWKLGKSVDSIVEEELEKSDAGPSEESNNNDGGGDSRQLQRTSSNCVRSHATIIFRNKQLADNYDFRFKDPHHQEQSESERTMASSDPNKSSFFERTLSWGSKPKIMSRQRMNTFSHCQYYTINGDD